MVDFDRLLINFQSESDGLLEESEEDILKLEKEANPQVIDKIFRAVHTIKGNSGLFDLPKIRELAHSMENSLNHYRNHPPDFIPETTIDLYLTTIDRLKTLLSDLKNNEAIDIQDLVQSFQSLNETKANLDPIIAPAMPNAPALAPQVNPGKSRNLKISINKKFIKIAEANNHYLALVIVKVKSIAGAQDLKSFVDFFEKRKSEGIVQVSTVSELLPSWQEAGNNDWKIYFLLNCQDNPKSALANMEIEYDSLRILYDPKDISIVRKMDPPSDKKVEPNQQTSLEALKKDLSNVDNSILGDTKELESTKDSYLKVSLRLIDDLINLAGEAVIARNELIQRIDTTTDSNLLTSAKKIGTLFSKLQEGIMKTRLQELDAVFQKVPRIVRDITRTNGKEAELVSVGGHVELDKTLIDAISDPIMHMVRNSLDHGLETPEERTRAGKSSKGMIRLSATLRGGNVIISIEDDGQGLDREKIQRKIVEKNIMTQEQAESASDEEIFNTVFLPGFSTAEKVTTVSGRGVGMDVVRTNLKKVGGSAEISNRPEGGSIVSLTIPQTLSIVNTLLIRTAGRRYAIPEQNVKELLLIDKTKLSRVETHLIYNLRDHLLPVLDLADFLSIPKSQDYDPKYMAVLKSEKHSFGIILDEIINPEEIVVKSLGSLFSGLSIFSGATIMGDGETVLILDVPGMAKFWSMQSNLDEKELHSKQNLMIQSDQKESLSKGYLLFSVGEQQFGVSVESVPRIEEIQLSDIKTFQGFEVILYRDRSVPLVRLDAFYEIRNSRLNDELSTTYGIFFKLNGRFTGILADSVEKVINDLPELKKDTYRGEGILGYAVVDDVHTLFLDIDHLSEKYHKEKFHDADIISMEEGVA